MRSSFVSSDARKLWRETTKAYAMMPHEKLVLRGACRALDQIALLEAELEGASLLARGSMGQDVANPLLGELRAQQAAFDRAVKQLDLPDEGESSGRAAANRSTSARAAAAARWGLDG